MKSKALAIRLLGVVVLVSAVTTGCDWTTNTDHWSDEYNWVNFSGVYRGFEGGLLVTDYTQTPATDDTTYRVNNERIATGNGVRAQFSGVLRNREVVAGSLTISLPDYQLVDQGNGTLTGNMASGTINYETGAWAIDLGAVAPANGTAIVANYEYVVGGTGSRGPGRGSTGVSIHTFTVFQEGNILRITDNNGAVYEGNFGSVTASGGEIVAQFTATGVSAAGMQVTMAGTFQGQGTEAQGAIGQKRMLGTWIEDGGRTGDINGFSS